MLAQALTCEAAGFGQQAACINAAAALVGPAVRQLLPDGAGEMVSRAEAHAMAGAFESAVLALMPAAATFTGGRLADGSVVAQVVLGPDAGAHSREARWLAMGWLAALLRAFAARLAGSGYGAAVTAR